VRSVKIGVISDIHANIHALRAVWKVLEEAQVSQVLCLGDLVGYGATPGEVIRFFQENKASVVMGSADARLAFDFKQLEARQGIADQTLSWTKERLSEEEMKYLRGLPMTGRIQTDLGRVRFMHGLPDDPDGRIDMMASPGDLGKILEETNCQIFVTGGSHIPGYREFDGNWVINPGSVGLSLNGEPGADCAILDFSGSRLQVELKKVNYPFSAAAFDIMTWDLPGVIADVIRTGSSRK
jgi:putative phosphoesterase